jgi:hypothetical protein
MGANTLLCLPFRPRRLQIGFHQQPTLSLFVPRRFKYSSTMPQAGDARIVYHGLLTYATALDAEVFIGEILPLLDLLHVRELELIPGFHAVDSHPCHGLLNAAGYLLGSWAKCDGGLSQNWGIGAQGTGILQIQKMSWRSSQRSHLRGNPRRPAAGTILRLCLQIVPRADNDETYAAERNWTCSFLSLRKEHGIYVADVACRETL